MAPVQSQAGAEVGVTLTIFQSMQIMCVLLMSAVKCDCKCWCCTVYMQTMCVLLTSAVAVGAGAVFMQMLCVLLTFAVKC